MTRSSNKNLRKIFGQLTTMGMRIEKARCGHMKIYGPDGRYLISTACSPANADNQVKNLVRDLKKYHGIVVTATK